MSVCVQLASEIVMLRFVLFMLKDLKCCTWVLECAAIRAVIDILRASFTLA